MQMFDVIQMLAPSWPPSTRVEIANFSKQIKIQLPCCDWMLHNATATLSPSDPPSFAQRPLLTNTSSQTLLLGISGGGWDHRCYQQEQGHPELRGAGIAGVLRNWGAYLPFWLSVNAGMLVCVIPGVPPTEGSEKEADRQGWHRVVSWFLLEDIYRTLFTTLDVDDIDIWSPTEGWFLLNSPTSPVLWPSTLNSAEMICFFIVRSSETPNYL